MATTQLQKPNGSSVPTTFPSLWTGDDFFAPRWFARMLDRFDASPFFSEFGAAFNAPAVNLYEKDGNYVLECALPGYTKDEVKIEATDGALTISGSYSHEKAEEKARYHRRELRRGSFSRTIELPQPVDYENASAKFENGMLKLTLKPRAPIASKTIPIAQ